MSRCTIRSVVYRKNGEKLLRLGKRNTFVSVRPFKGVPLVHVRRFTSPEENGFGDYLPTVQGIALSAREFQDMLEKMDDLRIMVDQIKRQMSVVDAMRNPHNGASGDNSSTSTASSRRRRFDDDRPDEEAEDDEADDDEGSLPARMKMSEAGHGDYTQLRVGGVIGGGGGDTEDRPPPANKKPRLNLDKKNYG